MKKRVTLLATVFVILLPIISYAGPYLICDVYSTTVTQPTEFEVYMDGATSPVISPAQSVTGGVRLHYDLTSISVANHSVTIKAVRVDPIWGRLVSASSVPFSFTRPGLQQTPTGTGLEP